MKKARLLTVVVLSTLLYACGGPSVRYKKDVSSMLNHKNYDSLEAKIKESKSKVYGDNNELLYYLDLSIPQTESYQFEESNRTLSQAQDLIEELQVKSVTQGLGTLIINDTTTPYRAPAYEQALTYFYRGIDYLSMDDLNSAAVEARRAVFFLDAIRENKKDGYNDDPFVQYFASMIFEDIGQRSSARISRTNARNAYERYMSWSAARAPDFRPPEGFRRSNMGEAVIFHFNGKIPFKVSNTLTFAWNDLWFAVNGNTDLDGVDSSLINSIYAGAFGKSVSVAFADLQDNPYTITSSQIIVADDESIEPVATQLVSDLSANAKKTLQEQNAAAYTRTLVRAVTKYILSVQARHAATNATDNENIGVLVGSLFSAFSALTEKADARSWFTLPAEIRMASVFLPEGEHNIKILFKDSTNTTIDEHLFEKVQIKKGERTYLYHRTSK